MSFSFKNNEPLFLQIANAIKRLLVAGTYAAGAKIPSIRDMAIEFEVTPNTVQRALQILEQEGLIYTARTSGKYVTQDKLRIERLRDEALSASISELITELLSQSYSSSDIRETVIKELSKHDGL